MNTGKHIYKITAHGDFADEAALSAALAPLGMTVTGWMAGYTVHHTLAEQPDFYPGFARLCYELVYYDDHLPETVYELGEQQFFEFEGFLEKLEGDKPAEVADQILAKLSEWGHDLYFAEELVTDLMREAFHQIKRGESLAKLTERLPAVVPGLTGAIHKFFSDRNPDKPEPWNCYPLYHPNTQAILNVCHTDEVAKLTMQICAVLEKNKQLLDARHMTAILIQNAYKMMGGTIADE